MASRLYPINQFFDNSGNLLSNGYVYGYAAGTTTPKLLFPTKDDATNGTNGVYVISLAAEARATVWFDDTTFLKLVIKSSGNVSIISTIDNIPGEVASTQAVITGRLAFAVGGNVASATTTDLSNTTGNIINITGTTTITSFGIVPAGTIMWVVFTGVLILTHNATSLILPGAANITTAAGDQLQMKSEGSGNWRIIAYTYASGTTTTAGGDLSGTYPNPVVAKINGKAIVLGGTLTTSGASALTLTTTGATNVTLPTTGTLVATTTTSIPSLNTIGTITTGIWNGSIIRGIYGGGTTVLASGTITPAAASLSLTSLISSTYLTYTLRLFNFSPTADNVALLLRTSSNNGVSYDSAAANYSWAHQFWAYNGGTAGTSSGGAGDTSIIISNGNGNAAGESVSFEITFRNPQSTGLCFIDWVGSQVNFNGDRFRITGSGIRQTGTFNAIQLTFATTTLAGGAYELWGHRT